MPSPNVPARVAADAQQADADLAQLAASLQAASNDGATPPAPTNEVPPAPAAAPAPAPTPAPPVEPVNDEYLRRMQAQIDSLQGRHEATLQEKARLEAQLQLATATPPAAPPPAANLITERDETEFGTETLDMVRRAVADETRELREEVARLRTQLSGMEGRFAKTAETTQFVAAQQQRTTEERFYDTLGQRMPGWEAVNVDPAFDRWLDGIDPIAGAKYGKLLADAYKALDAGRVIAIFTRYKPELANGNPPAAATPATPKSPSVDPTSQLAPATTGATTPPSSSGQGRIFDSSEYDKMCDDFQKKRITKETFAAFEREYFAAVAEGRVRLS